MDDTVLIQHKKNSIKTVSLLRIKKEKIMIGSINKVPYKEQVSIAYNIFAKGNTRKEEVERMNDR